MIIGVPKEIKDQRSAGRRHSRRREGAYRGRPQGAGGDRRPARSPDFDDAEYQDAGAEIVGDAGYVWGKSEMVVKVKEPIEKEYVYFREGLVLFTYLHLAPMPRADQQAAGIESHRHRL